MAVFTNSQILSAVIAEWAKPAITQIASSKLMQIPALQNLQNVIANSGLVGSQYSLITDLNPILDPLINTLVAPMIEKYLDNIPDKSIPYVSRAMVDEMKNQGTFSILNGLVTFDKNDIDNLDSMLVKNMPVENCENYQVIH